MMRIVDMIAGQTKYCANNKKKFQVGRTSMLEEWTMDLKGWGWGFLFQCLTWSFPTGLTPVDKTSSAELSEKQVYCGFNNRSVILFCTFTLDFLLMKTNMTMMAERTKYPTWSKPMYHEED
jgi:hypothetical protein